MDSNGYNDSVFDTVNGECFWCHSHRDTVRHEVYYGVAYRSGAKALGLWVNLCPTCHQMIHNGVAKKKTKRWRIDGKYLLIDALADVVGEQTATQYVDEFVAGSIKGWKLKEMEEWYGRKHRRPRTD